MEQTTQSAAEHNIVAEEEVGMMSAALKRSPSREQICLQEDCSSHHKAKEMQSTKDMQYPEVG